MYWTTLLAEPLFFSLLRSRERKALKKKNTTVCNAKTALMTVTQKLELRRLDLMCWASFSSPLPGKLKEPLLTGWYCLHILIQFSVHYKNIFFIISVKGTTILFFLFPFSFFLISLLFLFQSFFFLFLLLFHSLFLFSLPFCLLFLSFLVTLSFGF